MKTKFILTLACQVLGVFPINVKGTAHTTSRLYLASSCLVLLYLTSTIVLFIMSSQEDNNKHVSCGLLSKFGYFLFFTKSFTSIVAVTSNIVCRHKNVNFYNKLITLTSRHQYKDQSPFKIPVTFNVVVMIAISFLCLQGILNFVSFSILNRDNFSWYTVYNTFIEYPIFFDTIVFCILCTVMANCHQQVKRQLTNIHTMYCTESADSNTQRNNLKIISNLIPGPTVTQRTLVADTSRLLKKMEQLRHTNLELFEMHVYCLSSRQFQLFFSLIEILLETIINVYTLLSTTIENLGMVVLCYEKLTVDVLSKLTRLFMLCYYSGKVFREAQDTKYILGKMRALSSEYHFVISTNAFVSQIQRSKQYKICGLSTLDMSFPFKILGYTINYVLVVVQFFGIQK